MNKESDQKIREPIVEGLFYPEDAEKLRATIQAYMEARPEPPGMAFAAVSPHAGYEKCGPLIAAAFRSFSARKLKRAVLIGPVHRDEEEGLFLPESSLFRTPLGTIEVDMEGVEELLSCGTKIAKNDIPHLEEHCLEVQLPFLQYLYPEVRIVPILIGRSTQSIIRMLTSALHVAFGEESESTIFIVTTNFSASVDKKTSKIEADTLIKLSIEKKSEPLAEGKAGGNFAACGIGGLAAVLALPAAGTVRLLERGSSRAEKDEKNVEYAALSIAAT